MTAFCAQSPPPHSSTLKEKEHQYVLSILKNSKSCQFYLQIKIPNLTSNHFLHQYNLDQSCHHPSLDYCNNFYLPVSTLEPYSLISTQQPVCSLKLCLRMSFCIWKSSSGLPAHSEQNPRYILGFQALHDLLSTTSSLTSSPTLLSLSLLSLSHLTPLLVLEPLASP